jgi:thioredoxin 1
MTHAHANAVRELIGATEGIVLVDFSAEWCPPCRMLDPVVEQLAAESPDVTLVRVDVDASPALTREHDVMSFPTLIFFVDGRPAQRLVGARGIAALREELEQVRTRTGVRP